VQDSFKEFIEYLNPALEHNVMNTIHYDELKKFWIFEKSEHNEIMFIARLMKASISVPNEVIINQGDSSDKMYFI
jgi:hypothetical protein